MSERNFFWNSIRRLLALLSLFLFMLLKQQHQQTLKKVLLSMLVVIQKNILIYSPNLSISHEFFASSVCRLSFLSTWSKNLLFRILFQPQYSPLLLKYLLQTKKNLKIKMIDCSKPFKYQFAIQNSLVGRSLVHGSSRASTLNSHHHRHLKPYTHIKIK